MENKNKTRKNGEADLAVVFGTFFLAAGLMGGAIYLTEPYLLRRETETRMEVERKRLAEIRQRPILPTQTPTPVASSYFITSESMSNYYSRLKIGGLMR